MGGFSVRLVPPARLLAQHLRQPIGSPGKLTQRLGKVGLVIAVESVSSAIDSVAQVVVTAVSYGGRGLQLLWFFGRDQSGGQEGV